MYFEFPFSFQCTEIKEAQMEELKQILLNPGADLEKTLKEFVQEFKGAYAQFYSNPSHYSRFPFSVSLSFTDTCVHLFLQMNVRRSTTCCQS